MQNVPIRVTMSLSPKPPSLLSYGHANRQHGLSTAGTHLFQGDLWRASELRKIYARCMAQGGCFMWGGGRSGKYGRIRLTLPHQESKSHYAHRLVYQLYMGNYQLPASLEVSHLCGKTLCVNPQHLVLEARGTNADRVHCHNQEECQGTHHPKCIV